MKSTIQIGNFKKELNFALNNSTYDKDDYISDFDNNMQKAIFYIQNHVLKDIDTKDISFNNIIQLIFKDYYSIMDTSIQNGDIESSCMLYIGYKYLLQHRDVLSNLLKKLDKVSLDELPDRKIFSESFDENLFYAALWIKKQYDVFCQGFKTYYPLTSLAVMKILNKKDKESAFVEVSTNIAKNKKASFSLKCQTIQSIHWVLYGLENPHFEAKSSSANLVEKYIKKDFIDSFFLDVSDSLKSKLINSLTSTFSLLDQFGSISESINIHNSRMSKIRLPGLLITRHKEGEFDNFKNKDIMEAYSSKLMSLDDLMSKDVLQTLDIEALLQLNSFYNNRLAKVLENYAKSLFILTNVDGYSSIIQNPYNTDLNKLNLSIEKINFDTIYYSLVKYNLLMSYAKKIFLEVSKNKESYKVDAPQTDNFAVNFETGSFFDSTSIILEIEKVWKDDYFNFFIKKLPNNQNSIYEDLIFLGNLYNAIFLAYENKNIFIKCEYAYWFLAMKEKLKQLSNFGIVLDDVKHVKGSILLASDPSSHSINKSGKKISLNFPNRVHIKENDFVEFWKSYTGSSLIRIYEGFNDFFVDDKYISTQILCPADPFYIKYLQELDKFVSKTSSSVANSKNKSQKKLTLIEKMESGKCPTGNSGSGGIIFTENMRDHLLHVLALSRLSFV